MSLFKKTNEEKIQRLVERLKNKEESAISDIQKAIQELRKEEKECEERIAEIGDLYEKYIQMIEDHQKRGFNLDKLLEASLTIMSS